MSRMNRNHVPQDTPPSMQPPSEPHEHDEPVETSENAVNRAMPIPDPMPYELVLVTESGDMDDDTIQNVTHFNFHEGFLLVYGGQNNSLIDCIAAKNVLRFRPLFGETATVQVSTVDAENDWVNLVTLPDDDAADLVDTLRARSEKTGDALMYRCLDPQTSDTIY